MLFRRRLILPENDSIREQPLTLTSIDFIKKGEVVASFLDNIWDHRILFRLLTPEVWGQMIAIEDIAPDTDIKVRPPVNVYCDGVFDLFHLGHQRHLKKLPSTRRPPFCWCCKR